MEIKLSKTEALHIINADDEKKEFFENEMRGYFFKLDSENMPSDWLSDFVMASRIEMDKAIEKEEYIRSDDMKNLESLEEEVKSIEQAMKNKCKSLKDFSAKARVILEQELGERCWIYMYDKNFNFNYPYLLTKMTYHPKESGNDYAYTEFELKRLVGGKISARNITATTDTMRAYEKNPRKMLEGIGFIFETEELYVAYRNMEEDYVEKREWQSKQVLFEGNKYINDDKYYRSRSRLDPTQASSKLNRKNTILEIPIYNEIHCYNLHKHCFEDLNSLAVELYVYDDKVAQKLILPEDHKDLIDILLDDDMENVGEDIIKGKGQGTIILTKGVAGVGKTSTSEIFSEKKKVPLYSVHSGQLGTTGSSMEKKLEDIFELAKRWECILLLDEADVYIRKRDDDINHNAIVATMLRTIEYYSGILFMTTNRIDDVDEAIESRCTAILKYELPSDDMKVKLWKLFISQFGLNVNDSEFDKLMESMDKMSGRDIKNVCLLAKRFANGKGLDAHDVSIFNTCATFRGLKSIK